MADEKVIYNNVPPVASDFKTKQNPDGSWDVINTNTGIYEANYNTKTAADTYVNQKTAGVSEKASQTAAQAVDTGGKVDNSTTVSDIQARRTEEAAKPLSEITSTTISPRPVEAGSVNTDPNPNAVITPANPETQPSNLQVAKVDIIGDNKDENTTESWKVDIAGRGNIGHDDDWRVRLRLASKADYLYKDPNIKSTHLLYPLVETNGVVFPYTPQIQVNYRANYNNIEITHTNYKNHFYTNSSVDEVTITADFTAQDNLEAKYMLAVIHFFRSVTKMFYGQDVYPVGGTPPPLCFLTGFGSYQFSNHPLVITGFNYQLPTDVDYIRTDTSMAYTAGGIPVQKPSELIKQKTNIFSRFLSSHRLGSSNLNKQAKPAMPNFQSITSGESITYVPSKLQIQLACLPIVSRNKISNRFKLNGSGPSYSSGGLYEEGFW